METEIMPRIYVGKKPCGCVVVATLEPEDLKGMAEAGLLIETVDRRFVEVTGCQCEKDGGVKLN